MVYSRCSIDDIVQEVRRPRLPESSVAEALLEPVECTVLFTTNPTDWKITFRKQFSSACHINEVQLRTMVDGCRWFTRSRSNRSSRVVVMCDSLVSVCSIRKGRSSASSLLKHCRRLVDLSLVFDLQVVARWVPMHRNMADRPPRSDLVPGPCLV